MAVAIGVAEAKNQFSEILAKAAFAGQRFIVERRGKPMAAIIGIQEYEEFVQFQQEQRRQRFEGLRAAAAHMPEREALDLAQEAVDSVRHRGLS
jgi:prevent-host-death family protein